MCDNESRSILEDGERDGSHASAGRLALDSELPVRVEDLKGEDLVGLVEFARMGVDDGGEIAGK